MTAALIGLDWRTTFLRAFLMSNKGEILDETQRNNGIMQVNRNQLPNLFEKTVTPWRKYYPDLPAFACGMIGSNQGWMEAPCCNSPVGIHELSSNLISLPHHNLHIIPGIECREPLANVMRGEETEIIGTIAQHPSFADDALLVLPGTHSKWVPVKKGRILPFQTFITGEIYALLSQYSILGRPAKKLAQEFNGEFNQAKRDRAFCEGVTLAFNAKYGASQYYFTVRSRMLNGDFTPAASLDYLSGLLIGDEIRTARQYCGTPSAIIANQSLAYRYQQALSLTGLVIIPIISSASQLGIFTIAQQSGLIARKI